MTFAYNRKSRDQNVTDHCFALFNHPSFERKPMPPQTQAFSLSAKSRGAGNKAIAEYKDAPVEYGRQDLPPGIKGGIARLERAYFGEYKTGDNQGQAYLYLEGVVLEPYSVMYNNMDVVVEGAVTKQILAYCATKGTKPKTQAENIRTMMNEVKKLGGEDFLANVTTEAQLEAKVKQLEQAHPYFKFETRQGTATPQYPNPRTFESWFGSKGMENYEPGQGNGGVEDATGSRTANPSSNGVGASVTDTSGAFDEFGGDISSLVEVASQDEESQETLNARVKLQEMAKEAGISEEDVQEAPSWQAIADLIESGGDRTTEESQEDTTPVLKRVYKFHPIDPKTKKPGKKAVEVSVLSIDEKNKTARCKNVESPKIIYEKISWDALSDAD